MHGHDNDRYSWLATFVITAIITTKLGLGALKPLEPRLA